MYLLWMRRLLPARVLLFKLESAAANYRQSAAPPLQGAFHGMTASPTLRKVADTVIGASAVNGLVSQILHVGMCVASSLLT